MRPQQVLWWVYAAGLLLAPVVLWFLPADYFDRGQTVCLSVRLFDLRCYGCGMTRAIQHLMHLEFRDAYLFNKLSFLVLPVLWVLWYKQVRGVFLKLRQARNA